MKKTLTFILTCMMVLILASTIMAAAPSIALDKTEYMVGDPVMVTASGDGEKDWVAIYDKGAVPGVGTDVAHQWYYIPAHNGETVNMKIAGDQGTYAGEDLDDGEYTLYYCLNDGYEVAASIDFVILAPEETEAETIPETEAPAEEETVAETVAEAVEEAAAAPQTFDGGMIAAAASIIAMAGIALRKNRR